MKEIFSFEYIRNKFSLSKFFQNAPAGAPPGYKCAAVVLPLVQEQNQLKVLFTRRTATVRDHQNQVSFPGGGCESIDETFLDTALREMEEEIGIQITPEAVLGALEPRKTITGYYITPFVAALDMGAKMRINPAEVLRVIKVPLKWLADGRNFRVEPYQRPGTTIHDVIFYTEYDGEVIWGITAEILRDFIDWIKK